MAETAPKSKPVERTSIRGLGTPEDRVVDVVERTARLSGELLSSLESSERAAIEAVGQFVISVEEAIPTEVTATADVARMITKSGLETADQLVHTGYDLLRHAADGATGWVIRRDGASPVMQ